MNETSLARFLRALTSLGIFAEDTSGRYRQTPLSEALADHPESIRPLAMMLGARFIWEPVGWLDESIRTGQAAFERVHSAPFFRHLLMMVLTDGRERTELEFRSLLQEASFSLDSSNLYTRPLHPRKSACLRSAVVEGQEPCLF
jgi:hypothetical protein